VVSQKYPSFELVFYFMKKKWFCFLKEIKNEGINIEKNMADFLFFFLNMISTLAFFFLSLFNLSFIF